MVTTLLIADYHFVQNFEKLTNKIIENTITNTTEEIIMDAFHSVQMRQARDMTTPANEKDYNSYLRFEESWTGRTLDRYDLGWQQRAAQEMCAVVQAEIHGMDRIRVRGRDVAVPVQLFKVWRYLLDDERAALMRYLMYARPVEAGQLQREALDVIDSATKRQHEHVLLRTRPVRKVKAPYVKKVYDHGPYRDLNEPVEEEWEFVRNPNLLARLHAKINGFFYPPRECMEMSVVTPEMEEARGEDERPVHASNVVLGETQQESTGGKIVHTPDYYVNLSSSEDKPSYSNLTDRYNYCTTFAWNRSHARDVTLLSYRLPRAALATQQDPCVAPPFVPFTVHRYARMGMELKLQINSNKFQVGQLQCSWQYLEKYTANPLNTVYERAQLPHCLINAGAGNEATLYVPFYYYKPYMHTKKREGFVDPLDMGTLTVKVLSPLAVADGGPSVANVSLFVRFLDASFTGMIDANLDKPNFTVVEPEMEAVIEEVGMMALRTAIDYAFGDKNCDNPPDLKPAEFVVPATGHSWSIGNGESHHSNMLRLSAVKGCGRKGDPDVNELDMSYPCSVWGMLKVFSWNSKADENIVGKLLWSTSVHPMCDKDKMYSFQQSYTNSMKEYVMPPTGVVSSMFQYWRGSLEYRFDIVASQFHSGRLLVAYIPGVADPSKVTLAQARNSAHTVFSLQEATSFTFVVPFIADKPWWGRRYAGPQRKSEFVAPSGLVVFVLNPLVVMDRVVPNVEIIPYVRAGRDFELAIPVQPAVGISDEAKNYLLESEKLRPLEGYSPYYLGKCSLAAEINLFRYGPVALHYAQFSSVTGLAELDLDSVYLWTLANPLEAPKVKAAGSPAMNQVRFALPITYQGYNYAMGFTDVEKAIGAAASWRKYHDTAKLLEFDSEWVESDAQYGAVNLVYSPKIYSISKLKPVTDFIEMCGSFVHVTAEMEERREQSNVLQPTSRLPSTSAGRSNFGEQFISLKDVLRRYQLYWEGVVTPVDDGVSNRAILQFPATPSGLSLDITNSNQVWNVLRDGAMGIVSSGYRYFRGGLRFRIVFPADLECNAWVQHHPDKPANLGLKATVGAAIHEADAFRNHQYGFYIQSLKVNNVLSVSVPFYQPGVYGVLRKLNPVGQQTDLVDYVTLGDIVVGLESTVTLPKSVPVSVYVALEDDMSFNVFQGFPPVVFCEDTVQSLKPKVTYVKPEMMPVMKAVGVAALLSAASYVGVRGAMNGASVMAEKTALRCVDTIMTKHVVPAVEEVKQDVGAAACKMANDVEDAALNSVFRAAFGNVMHVLVNPTPRTLAVAVVNCIVQVCYSAWELTLKFYSVMEEFFLRYWAKFVGTTEPSVVEPEGVPGLYDDDAATSMLFTLACALIGVKNDCKKPGGYANLMRNVSQTVQLPVNVMRFLGNCKETLVYFCKWLRMKDAASIRAQIVLDEDLPDIKMWFKEAQYLLDPRNRGKVESNRLMNNRVYDAVVVGGLLVANGLSESLPGGRVLWDTYKELCKMRTRLVDMGCHPDVRFEAFSVWINGGAGLGKSTMAAELSTAMLKKIKYKTNGAACYYLQPGAKWWNGYTEQPVIIRDDAYQITTGPSFEEELTSHFAICSCCVLNPPKAAVEEKHLRANPLVYMMLANVAFPAVINNVADAKAIYRRRKFMVEAKIKPEVLREWQANNPGVSFTDASQLPAHVTENFGHVVFAVYHSPSDPSRSHGNEWFTFDEMKDKMVDAFVEHYAAERVKFRKRVRDMYLMCSENGESADETIYTELPELAEAASLQEQIATFRARAQEHLASLGDPELEQRSYWQHLKAGVLSFANKFVPEGQVPTVQTTDATAPNYVSPEAAESVWHQVLRVADLPAEANALIANVRWSDPAMMAFFALDPRKDISCATFEAEFRTGSKKVLFPLFMPKEQFTKITIGETEYSLNALKRIRKFNERALDDRFETWGTTSVPVDERLRRYLMAVLAYSGSASVFDAMCFWTSLKIDILKGECDILDLAAKSCQWEAEIREGKCGVCPCARFWGTVLSERGETVRYSKTRDCFFYTDCIGLSMQCPRHCTHAGSITGTAVFRRLICLWHEKMLERRGETTVRESTSVVYQAQMEELEETMTRWEKFILGTKKWYEEGVKPFVARVLRFLINALPSILATLAGFVVTWGVKYAANKLFSGSSEGSDFGFESHNYYKWDAPKANAKPSASNSIPSFQSSPTARVQMIRKLTNNTIFLEATWVSSTGTRCVQSCRCFIPFGRRVIMLRHYLEEFAAAKNEQGATNFKLRVIFNVSGKQSSSWVDPDQLFSTASFPNVESNFVLVEMPKSFPCFKTVLHLFASKAHHTNLGATCDLYPITECANYDLPVAVKKNYLVAGDAHVTDVKMGRVYTYLRHGKGLCGSLLVCPSVNAGLGGIVGMHVAGSGSTGEGVAEPLYREMFDTAFANRTYAESEVMTMNLEPVSTEKMDKLDSNMMLYGCVPQKYAHHESGKTKIVPSLIQGAVYPVRTEPNPLKPDDPRQPPGSHPLYDGCRKHGSGNVIGFDPERVKIVVEAEKAHQRLTTLPVRAEIKPFTLEQAICGDLEVPYCEALNWKSSEGFPLRIMRPKNASDKRWLFDLEETSAGYKLKGLQPVLVQQLEMRDLCFARNVKPHTVYEDCTKDYRLTPAKCAIPGKTRIFSIAPVQCTIDCKMYLGDLCCAIKNSRIYNGVAIGINPDSIEWTKLVHYLHEVGTNIITLDYSNYGPTLMSQLVEGAVEIFVDWMKYRDASPEHVDRVEWILRNDIMNPVHLCEDVVYQTLNGIASGSPITGEMNSIPNKLYMRLAWLELMKDDPTMFTMSAFDEHVRIVAYGDDNIMSVSDAAVERYNAVTIAECLRKHGIILTNATKQAELVTHGTILDATFLKRGFAKHPTRAGIWLAPLDTASIEECVNWIHACNDKPAATIQACEASLDLAFGMGPEWYEQHRQNLTKAVQRMGSILRSKTWRERDAEVFGDSCVDRIDLSPKIDWFLNNDYYSNC